MSDGASGRSLRRTVPGFFSRSSTARFIKSISQQKRLVIYVGAGVTISDSGTSWESLMKSLLSITNLPDDDIGALTRNLPTLHQASIIWHHYKRKHRANPLGTMADAIAGQIYRENQWRSGDYPVALIKMVQALVRTGTQVTIVTTNYDNYLQQAASLNGQETEGEGVNAKFSTWRLGGGEDEASTGNGTSAEVFGESQLDVPIVHLHGLIQPRHEGPSETTELVFSEKHYHLSQNQIVETLVRAFERSSVLILGSSLNDSPLLQALAQTSGNRWAIYPRAAAASELDAYRVRTPGAPGDPMREIIARAKEFDLSLVVPDFFSQASQFLREVGRARELAVSGGTYADAKGRTDYDLRLASWWTTWSTTNLVEMERRQRECVDVLQRALDELRATTGDLDERLKLELWVRWNPAARYLQLWASSTGTWPDNKIARRVPIEAKSDYIVVNAFTEGQVLLARTEGRSDRWERYFAVPIRQEKTLGSEVLGVLTVATTNPEETTRLDEDEPAILEAIARQLRSLGRELLLNPEPLE